MQFIKVYAVKFSGRRQLLIEAIFKLRQPESEPVLDIISGYTTLRMQLPTVTGVKRNFWPLRNFWPVVVFQLFCFSE